MKKPVILVSANDKYERMVGIQITEKPTVKFYPGDKDPKVLNNGQESYCIMYGSYSGDFFVDNNPLMLYDYDYIEFEFEDKKINNDTMDITEFIDKILPYIRYYWEINSLNSLK